ncbi:MAG: hypothetical protein R3D71_02385 [Rickettsiales bacterium]
MTLLEQKLQEFELRPAVYDAAEQHRRAAMYEHFSAINKFEGLFASELDNRLFALLAAGKVSKNEYLELCLTDARSGAQ